MNNWKEISVSPEMTVIEAMKIIDKYGTQFVIVLDESDILLGVLTDGDIRRGLLKNISLSSPIAEMMNKTPKFLPSNISKAEALEFLEKHHFTHVPLVDKNRVVVNVIGLNERGVSSTNRFTAVLMVGGLGSRLGELTSNCPKPMLPVGGKPLLEIILENLKEHGFRDFIFCVNYRSEMIRSYFEDGSKFGVMIRYVQETKRMGTAGALALLPNDVSDQLLVMNGDIVTKVNFTGLLDFHREQKCSATMAVRKYDFQIPYGVVKTEANKIVGIEEKPVHSFLVSAGIYIVNRKAIAFIPKDHFFDMPQLFQFLIDAGETTEAFPIHEYWLDIGREDDLIRAQQDFHGDTQ